MDDARDPWSQAIRVWSAPTSPDGVTAVRDEMGREWQREGTTDFWRCVDDRSLPSADWVMLLVKRGTVEEIPAVENEPVKD